jgi:hypothetical protein
VTHSPGGQSPYDDVTNLPGSADVLHIQPFGTAVLLMNELQCNMVASQSFDEVYFPQTIAFLGAEITEEIQSEFGDGLQTVYVGSNPGTFMKAQERIGGKDFGQKIEIPIPDGCFVSLNNFPDFSGEVF